MKEQRATGERSIQSLDRAFDILDALARVPAQGLSLKAICAATELHPSTAHHLIATMVARGYLAQDAGTRHYMLGPALLRLRALAASGMDLQRLALPFAQELVDRTGEGSYLSLLRGWDVATVIALPSPHPVRVVRPTGPEPDLHATAAGKCLLAYEPEAVIDQYFREATLTAFTPKTVTDGTLLRAELAQVQRNGLAFDDEEHAAGVSCIAAPVYGDGGEVVAALSIAYPTFRGAGAAFDQWCSDVRACAAAFSRRLGHGTAMMETAMEREPSQESLAADG